jgi:hypothetical protein
MKRAAMIGCTYYHRAMAPALAEEIPAREELAEHLGCCQRDVVLASNGSWKIIVVTSGRRDT